MAKPAPRKRCPAQGSHEESAYMQSSRGQNREKQTHRSYEINSDHQYHSKQNKNQKFQEHCYTPKYWKMSKT
eukprot:5250840-Amphidinium_carterae.1